MIASGERVARDSGGDGAGDRARVYCISREIGRKIGAAGGTR